MKLITGTNRQLVIALDGNETCILGISEGLIDRLVNTEIEGHRIGFWCGKHNAILFLPYSVLTGIARHQAINPVEASLKALVADFLVRNPLVRDTFVPPGVTPASLQSSGVTA